MSADGTPCHGLQGESNFLPSIYLPELHFPYFFCFHLILNNAALNPAESAFSALSRREEALQFFLLLIIKF
jgi:hypothetical protein